MIPKIIHYCWFGKSKKSEAVNMYIENWKNILLDYTIIEWNEKNFNINCNDYVREAYKAKKWAFVSDYARLWVLYSVGGIYLDTDVEILQSFDSLLENSFFIGGESKYSICTAVIGARADSDIVKELLSLYDGKHFLIDGRENAIPNSQLIFNYFKEIHDYKVSQNVYATEQFSIYPSEYFSPINCYTLKKKITPNTYTVHHFASTWKTDNEIKKEKLKSVITRIIGEENRQKIKQMIKR